MSMQILKIKFSIFYFPQIIIINNNNNNNLCFFPFLMTPHSNQLQNPVVLRETFCADYQNIKTCFKTFKCLLLKIFFEMRAFVKNLGKKL